MAAGGLRRALAHAFGLKVDGGAFSPKLFGPGSGRDFARRAGERGRRVALKVVLSVPTTVTATMIIAEMGAAMSPCSMAVGIKRRLIAMALARR